MLKWRRQEKLFGGSFVKKVRKQTVLSFILIPMLLLSMLAMAPATTNAETDLGLTVDAAILIDADTGKIL